MSDQQIVSITFFRFESGRSKWKALQAMGLSTSQLASVKGLTFGKMLGSGAGNGFSIRPNFGVYGFLGIWKNQEYAQQFFDGHDFFHSLSNEAEEIWTTLMRVSTVHGQWEAHNPFQVTEEYNENRLVGVLTRATIYTKHLWNFWRFVPSVSKAMDEHKEGLLFSVGIGEMPLFQQATFSFWQNSKLMKAYAYKSKHHREVIKKTRELGWYKEELFARFHPFASRGSWNGENPLLKYL